MRGQRESNRQVGRLLLPCDSHIDCSVVPLLACPCSFQAEHFKYHRDVELEQLRGFLQGVGLEGNLLEAVVAQVGRDDSHLMKIMMAFEFGAAGETAERNPLLAMWTSGRLFIMGALPTVIPFFIVTDPFQGLWIAGILVAVALFVVGVYKSRTTMGQ
jgi:VIT1/CCC1 family predicted Fe2+/Mn2+ transporter